MEALPRAALRSVSSRAALCYAASPRAAVPHPPTLACLGCTRRRVWCGPGPAGRPHAPCAAVFDRPSAGRQAAPPRCAALGCPAAALTHPPIHCRLPACLRAWRSYAFYSHLVSTRMLPLRRLRRWTKRLREHLPHGALANK